MQQTRMNQPLTCLGGWVSRVIASSFPLVTLKESRFVIGAIRTRANISPYPIRVNIWCALFALLMLMWLNIVSIEKTKVSPVGLLVDVWCGPMGVFVFLE